MKLCALLSLLLFASGDAFQVSPKKDTKPAVTTPTALEAWTMNDFNLFGDKNAIVKKFIPAGHTILEPNLDLANMCAIAASTASYGLHQDDLNVAFAGLLFHLVLGGWIGVQANRVRCVFDKEAVEFYNLKGSSSSHLIAENYAANIDPTLEHKSPNWLTRTPNRWNYKTISGYRFYPSINFPVICVLWETETKGSRDTHIMRQPHFFPLLFSAKEFKANMDKHGVKYDDFGFE